MQRCTRQLTSYLLKNCDSKGFLWRSDITTKLSFGFLMNLFRFGNTGNFGEMLKNIDVRNKEQVSSVT